MLRRTGGAIYPKSSLVENVEFFLVAAIVILGIRTYFLQPFKIPTNSMWPTYNGMTPEAFHDIGEIVAESEKSGQSGFKALVHMAGDDLVDVREWICVSKDGRRIPTLRTMTALRDTNGTLLGYLAIYRDLTVAKEAERLLESAKNAALQARVLHD